MKLSALWQRILARGRRQSSGETLAAGVMLQDDVTFDGIPPCPRCKATDVARIIYGKPPLTRQILEGLESGRLVSGGCLVHQGAPAWRCNRCNRDFGQLNLTATKDGADK